jgi:Arc/MetJ-type ribon-helix-helix transcriptional regulator
VGAPARGSPALAVWLTKWYTFCMTTTQVAVRLPDAQLARIDELVGVLHSSRSDVIRRAVDLYLYRLSCERDARAYEREPLSDAELALADDPEAWKGKPAW